MKGILVVLVALLLLSIVGALISAQDMGEAVVDAALRELDGLGWLNSNTHLFMKRVALCESNYGQAPGTYRSGYYGGIWQVDDIGFKNSQDSSSHPFLAKKFEELDNKMGIEWKNVKWTQCVRALYSVLAARLNLFTIPAAIPTSLQDQAQYWKTYYNTGSGKGSVSYFVDCCKQGGLGDDHKL